MIKIWSMQYKKLVLWGWKAYRLLAITAGSLVFLYVVFALIVLLPPVKTYDLVVPLQSGFVYHYDMQDGSVDGHHLEDKQGTVIVYSDVINFVESGKIIYGYRTDLHGNPFYFICSYGNDCSTTQNLTDVELRRIIKDRQLPLYTANGGISRSALERELKRFYKTANANARPEWEYDTQFGRYHITETQHRNIPSH